MLAIPPKTGFFLLGTLAGLVIAVGLVPHYGPGPSGLRALPFLPDLSPHLGEALVELGGPYGSAQRECAEDGGGDGGVSASASFLQGEVGDPLFDRLKPDEFYITVGNGAGLTNQIFGIIDALYLALLSSRIPILQPLHANHQIYREPGTPAHAELDVSQLFDLPRLIGSVPRLRGIVQWSDFYPTLTSDSADLRYRFANSREQRALWPEVGCWGEFVRGKVLEFARMRTDWTPYPPGVSLPNRRMSYIAFLPYLLPDSLYAATLPDRNDTLHPPKDKSDTSVQLRPNNQLACIDEGMAGTDRADESPFEEMFAGKGSWHGIGQFLRFTPELNREAARIVANAFGWHGDDHGNKHITVHIRHGDFLEFACSGEGESCYTVKQYLRAIKDIQSTLPEPIDNVLVLTDEKDPAFRAEAHALGWKFADDGKIGAGGEEIKARLKGWYETLTDIVLMASGSHFVGTHGSTMSVLALRRVEDWHGGQSRLVNPKSPE